MTDDRTKLPIRFYQNADVTLDEKGQPTVADETSRREISRCSECKELDLAFRDPVFSYHYFHFVELLLMISKVIFDLCPDVLIRNVFVGTQNWCNPFQDNVQKKLLSAIFSPEKIIERIDLATEVSNLLVVDRFLPIESHYNKFLEPIIYDMAEVVSIVKTRVLKHCGIRESSVIPKRCLYVTRLPPRALLATVETELLCVLRKYFSVEIVDFAKLRWEEQVKVASCSPLMIGVHGNGLTNSLWMPHGATLVEIFPENFHAYDYQFLAEINRMRYFGLEGTDGKGYVYTGGTRVGGHYGNENVPVTSLPWQHIRTLTEYHLANISKPHSP